MQRSGLSASSIVCASQTQSLATATFTASQFDNVNISTAVTVVGSLGTNRIVINGATDFSASRWNFSGWLPNSDTITINGTARNDVLTGSSQRDTINGFDGADQIRGGLGADTLDGGGGDDIFLFGAGDVASGESIHGGDGTDTLSVLQNGHFDFGAVSLGKIEALRYSTATSTAYFTGAQIGGTSALLTVTGNTSADALTVTGPSVDLSPVSFIDWDQSVDRVLINGDGGDNTLTGSAVADHITAGSGNDTVIGGLGNDVLSGNDGDDTLDGGQGNDILNGDPGMDILLGGGGNDIFRYTSQDLGEGGTIDGGGGNTDTIEIGLGFEVFFAFTDLSNVERVKFLSGGGTAIFGHGQIGTSGDFVSVRGSGSTDTLHVIGWSVNLSTLSLLNWSVSDIVLIQGNASLASMLIGSAKNDTITGGTGNDLIRGGAGADTMDGGDGIDRLSYSTALEGVTVNLQTQSTAGSSVTSTAFGDIISNFENVSGGSGDDTLTGSDGANSIDGDAGNDTIRAGGGADIVNGGGGNDVIETGAGEFLVGESLNGGADTDRLSILTSVYVDFAAGLVVNIEELQFSDGGGYVGFTGSQIGGTSLLMTVIGGAGADAVLVSGTQVDLSAVTFINWDAFSDFVQINGTAGDDVLTGSAVFDALHGSSGNDTLSGGGDDDFLSGGSGDDILSGGTGDDEIHGDQGADTMSGGGGNDRFVFRSASDIRFGESIDGGAGSDDVIAVYSDSDYDFAGISIARVERLVFAANENVVVSLDQDHIGAGGIVAIDGAAGQNVVRISGSDIDLTDVVFNTWSANDAIIIAGSAAAANVLTGSGMDDRITGGDLDDIVHGGAGADILDGGGGGVDTLSYAGAAVAVTVNLRTFSTAGSAVNSDAFGDVLSGFESSFENVIGGNGADTLTGSAAANRLEGGLGNDTINGGSGNDNLVGGGGNDRINGGTGSDLIAGGTGSDRLTGAAGKDEMTGGGGADRFIFLSIADSQVQALRDVITDFEQGSDRIDLSAIDAIDGTAANDVFDFIADGSFTGAAGELRYFTSNNNGGITIVAGDINGDGTGDFHIQLTGIYTLADGDFVL